MNERDVGDAFPELVLTPPHPTEGGYKLVYFAERGDERVVLKVYKLPLTVEEESGEPTLSPEELERAVRELAAIGSVDSANVSRLLAGPDKRSIAQKEFLWYLEPRYDTVLSASYGEFPWPQDRVRALAVDLLTAAVAIHDAGIVHRDIKPENIAFENETAVLLDFGIAFFPDLERITEPNVPSPRTRLFCAPEQISNDPPDFRTDLFLIGVTLYLATTGRHPFFASAGERLSDEILIQRMRAGPDKDLLFAVVSDSRLADTILRCLEFEPYRRFRTARRALKELQE